MYDKLENTVQRFDSNLILEDGQTAAQAFCNEIYAIAEASETTATSSAISFSDIFALEDSDDKAIWDQATFINCVNDFFTFCVSWQFSE